MVKRDDHTEQCDQERARSGDLTSMVWPQKVTEGSQEEVTFELRMNIGWSAHHSTVWGSTFQAMEWQVERPYIRNELGQEAVQFCKMALNYRKDKN